MSGKMKAALVCGWALSIYCLSATGAPDTWDPRLTTLGICWFEADVAPGTWYWKLVSGVYQDETQSGGNHHIYYKCLNAAGQPIENQKCWAGWGNTGSAAPCPTIPSPPDGTAWQLTKGAFDGYWANFGMSGGWCPFWPEGPHGGYGAWVDGPSDQVWGMGLPCNRHVNYLYVWKWTQAVQPLPTIARAPSAIVRTVTEGQNLPNDSFTVWNSGGLTLNYTITDDGSWMEAIPAAGSCTTETDTITICYTVGDLLPGSYSATITISDPNSTNKTETISVSLTVEGIVIPGDFDGDKDVDQADFGHFQACVSGSGIRQPEEACQAGDLDKDNDVDSADVGLFMGCLTGAGVQGNPDCVGSI